MMSNLWCVSEIGGVHVRFPTRIQFHPRCQQSHCCPHGLMGISLPGVPEMSHWSQVTQTMNMLWLSGPVPPPMQGAVFTRFSSRPKRLRVVAETRTFLSLLAHGRAWSERPLMRKRVEQAWRLRWGSLLSCSAARAVAMSLLDLPGSRGADGYCPLPHDVEQDFRHAGLDL